MDKNGILLFDIDGQETREIVSVLSALGHSVQLYADIESSMHWYRENRPPFVMANSAIPGSLQLVHTLRTIAADAIILVSSPAGRLGAAMKALKTFADEFLPRPVEAVALEIALQRSIKMKQLLDQAKNACGEDCSAQIFDQVAREVANERFLVVRQIIEKMSAFISQLASAVDGGVKYFNELPYFVSVHSPDWRVLAANATSLKFLGNRLYANSWEIYAGKRGTREACPVGRTMRSCNVETTPALVRLRYRSGAKVPVLVHAAPIYDNEEASH